ncbi:MAG: bifunctional DNA-formamidopyrimidine glycosylase/DNA-(apurinic or apyrimidinic site) lyase, partial [Hyphococcus sp.]
GATIATVRLARADLRFPFPPHFRQRLEGARVSALARRGKYLLAALSTDETLIMHLGMSGRFTIEQNGDFAPGAFAQAQACDPRHDHVVVETAGSPKARITYNDPRRFGFMDLVASDRLEECRHFRDMGPEPLGNAFSAAAFNAALKRRNTPVKTALLDQRLVAGVGNIYACEALFRAGVSPRRLARSVAGKRGDRLHAAVIAVLRDAINAGGSTLRDFAGADGALGYFQHRFDVYDREDAPCVACGEAIRRISQGGRSTFFCPACQR